MYLFYMFSTLGINYFIGVMPVIYNFGVLRFQMEFKCCVFQSRIFLDTWNTL